MNKYDVVIVGSGPAGGACARQLAQKDCKVFLADRIQDFSVNSYSSAGAPNEILTQHQLPREVVAADWKRFNIHSSKERLTVESDKLRGIVMDFSKLRSFLAREAEKKGGTVVLGANYRSHSKTENGISVCFKIGKQQELNIETKILVDATGSDRQVLKKPHLSNILKATGIEYLVNVPDEIYEKWANALSFFMGHHWMPQGYSWIFPMEKGRLKVGVCRYFQDEQIVPHNQSFDFYLSNMMRECLGTDQFPLSDKHGKTIRYSYSHKEKYFSGPVIAIGDSISTINPLALEGIRHAMASAKIAAEHIMKKLENPRLSFDSYQRDLQKYYGYKWLVCEKLASCIYRAQKDTSIDEMLEAYKGFSFDEIFDLGFHYNMRCILKLLFRWGAIKVKKQLGIHHKNM